MNASPPQGLLMVPNGTEPAYLLSRGRTAAMKRFPYCVPEDTVRESED